MAVAVAAPAEARELSRLRHGVDDTDEPERWKKDLEQFKTSSGQAALPSVGTYSKTLVEYYQVKYTETPFFNADLICHKGPQNYRLVGKGFKTH